jgi:competence protein ComGC
MNESNPISSEPLPPKTSALAIWSLVLGILSLFCFSIFAAIPGVICGHKALSRIKNSGGALAGQGLAIGGLVTGYIGVLLAIVMIPMMMAIAIPNFVKARETAQMNMCINNLRQIDFAKQKWALEHHKQATDVPAESDLTPYLGVMPKCPAGGDYKINTVAEKPTCSNPKHRVSE